MKSDTRDRERPQEQLEDLLLEGLASGTAEPWTEADVEETCAAVRERLKEGRGNHGGTQKIERPTADQSPSC